MRALIIDDDGALTANLRIGLRGTGIVADVADDAETGFRAALSHPYEAIVLDIMLGPGDDGFAVCRRLRRAGVATPILMLTALDSVPDRVRGLETGADDYLVKPFALEELAARIRALSRRHLDDRGGILAVGNVTVDTRTHAIAVDGRPLTLTERETELLELLVRHPTATLSQAGILESLALDPAARTGNLIEVYVGRLRRKLGEAGARVQIRTLKRQGYRLEVLPAGRTGGD